MWSFVSKFLITGEILIIGYLIGPDEVSNYSFSYYACAIGVAISSIVTGSITPGLGKLVGEKNYYKSTEIVKLMREMTLGIGVFLGIIILLFNKSFVSIWVGKELFVGDFNNLLIVILMLQLITIRNEAFIIDLSLKIRKKVTLGVTSVIFSFLAALILITIFSHQIKYILLGIFFGRIMLNFIYPKMVNKLIDNSEFNYSYNLILKVIIIFVLAFLLGQKIELENWLELILFSLLGVFGSILMVYNFIYSKNVKLFIESKIPSIINKS